MTNYFAKFENRKENADKNRKLENLPDTQIMNYRAGI